MRPLIIGNIIANLYFIISILSESLLCNSENHDFILYGKEYVNFHQYSTLIINLGIHPLPLLYLHLVYILFTI